MRIEFVVEGKTDYVVLKAIVEALLDGREYVATLLQPELSVSFERLGSSQPEGWPGVYKWCADLRAQSPHNVATNPVFVLQDIVILQLDADVADTTYAQGHIADDATDLPCARPCPPAQDTVDALQAVVLRWLGATSAPPKMVVCMPSKSLESWILAALRPDHRHVVDQAIECLPNPMGALQQGVSASERLVRAGRKVFERYQRQAPSIAANWANVTHACLQARSFEAALREQFAS